MGQAVVDALGREVSVPRAPRRIVSLVPSETETVAALAGVERLVGRTDYCEEPAGGVERIPSVGGTKRFDVGKVLDLAPDLVLANQEENGRADVEALLEHGVPVVVSVPCSVADALAYLERLAILLELDGPAREPERQLRALVERGPPPPRARVLAPIWRDPWMGFDARTYGSDVLAYAGGQNVLAGRPRRYPLAADLEEGPARQTDRDTRYPRLGPAELRRHAGALVLLPDEPFRFGPADAAELAALGLGPARFVSGKDLFWYGVRTAPAIARLACLLP